MKEKIFFLVLVALLLSGCIKSYSSTDDLCKNYCSGKNMNLDSCIVGDGNVTIKCFNTTSVSTCRQIKNFTRCYEAKDYYTFTFQTIQEVR